MNLCKKLYNNIINFFKTRQFKYGSNTLILIVALLGIIVVVNFLVQQQNIKWDLTENNRFSLSDQTKEILRNLDKEVKIYGFYQPESAIKSRVELLLDQYQDYTGNLQVEFIDPDRNPARAREYDVSSYGTTVVVGPEREKRISQYELFTMSRSQQGQQFQGEQVFTKALIDVTKTTTAAIYFVKGHGEYGLFRDLYQLEDKLSGEGYDVGTVNLASEPIPDEARVLVIAGPDRDYNPEEIEVIEQFTDRGGEVVVMLDPAVRTTERLNNLEEFITNWGLTAIDDLVVDRHQSYYYDPLTPVADLRYHSITRKLREDELVVVLPMVRSLKEIEDYDGDANVRLLLESSRNAWGEVNYGVRKIVKDDEDIEGRLPLAYAVTRSIESNVEADNNQTDTTDDSKSTEIKNENKEEVESEESREDISLTETDHKDQSQQFEVESVTPEAKQPSANIDEEMRAVVIGTSSFINNEMITQQANMDFMLNCINWLVEQEEMITIRPKDSGLRFVSYTGPQGNIIFYGTTIGIPLIIFVIGGIIWFRRRHL